MGREGTGVTSLQAARLGPLALHFRDGAGLKRLRDVQHGGGLSLAQGLISRSPCPSLSQQVLVYMADSLFALIQLPRPQSKRERDRATVMMRGPPRPQGQLPVTHWARRHVL